MHIYWRNIAYKFEQDDLDRTVFYFKIVKIFFFKTLVQFNNFITFTLSFFEWDRFVIAELSVSLTWGFWLPRKMFLIFGAANLSKTSTKLFSRVQYSSELRELSWLIKLGWKLLYVNFLKSRLVHLYSEMLYVNFLKSRLVHLYSKMLCVNFLKSRLVHLYSKMLSEALSIYCDKGNFSFLYPLKTSDVFRGLEAEHWAKIN